MENIAERERINITPIYFLLTRCGTFESIALAQQSENQWITSYRCFDRVFTLDSPLGSMRFLVLSGWNSIFHGDDPSWKSTPLWAGPFSCFSQSLHMGVLAPRIWQPLHKIEWYPPRPDHHPNVCSGVSKTNHIWRPARDSVRCANTWNDACSGIAMLIYGDSIFDSIYRLSVRNSQFSTMVSSVWH